MRGCRQPKNSVAVGCSDVSWFIAVGTVRRLDYISRDSIVPRVIYPGRYPSRLPYRLNDIEWLRDLYWKAGVAEYWLATLWRLPGFDILRHAASGCVTTSKSAGWIESTVFGHCFQLTRQTDEMGQPEYTLEAIEYQLSGILVGIDVIEGVACADVGPLGIVKRRPESCRRHRLEELPADVEIENLPGRRRRNKPLSPTTRGNAAGKDNREKKKMLRHGQCGTPNLHGNC